MMDTSCQLLVGLRRGNDLISDRTKITKTAENGDQQSKLSLLKCYAVAPTFIAFEYLTDLCSWWLPWYNSLEVRLLLKDSPSAEVSSFSGK